MTALILEADGLKPFRRPSAAAAESDRP
jgi:hypothetical protein